MTLCQLRSLAEECKLEAYYKWTNLITLLLGSGRATTSVVAIALILFPEAYNGQIHGKLLVFPGEEMFPNEVKRYRLAGGLNMTATSRTICIQKPEGCVLGCILSLTSNALHNPSHQEVEVFAIVPKSVDTEKGHLF